VALDKTIAVINELAKSSVLKNYAIAGAVAAAAYVQSVLTEDLDILIAVDNLATRPSGLLLLSPIEDALAAMGYTERSDVGVMVEDWPVQFIPVASDLDVESLQEAQDVRFDATPSFLARVLRPEHIVAKALTVGRFKDLDRIESFLDQRAVDLPRLQAVLSRHELLAPWKAFCLQAGRTDPLGAP